MDWGDASQRRDGSLWLKFGLAAGGTALLIMASTLWVAAQAFQPPPSIAARTSALDETIATRSRLAAKTRDQIGQIGCDKAPEPERVSACRELRATLAMFETQIAEMKQQAGGRWVDGGEVVKAGNFLDFLFNQVPGGRELKKEIDKNIGAPEDGGTPGAWQDDGRGIYRTMCVRLCDGYYWPMSYSANRGKLDQDEASCQSSCNSPAKLYHYPNNQGSVQYMVDRTGKPYSQLPNAFRHRVEYVRDCRCKPDPWTPEARAAFATRTDDPANAVAVAEANAHSAAAQPDDEQEPQAYAQRPARQTVVPNREKARAAAREQRRSWNPFDRVFGLW